MATIRGLSLFFLEITTIASKIHGAGQVTFADAARKQLEGWNAGE